MVEESGAEEDGGRGRGNESVGVWEEWVTENGRGKKCEVTSRKNGEMGGGDREVR